MEGLSHRLSSAAVVISVAAAVSVARIQGFLRKNTPVVRVMPNTPALAGAVSGALCFENVSDKRQEQIVNLFKTCVWSFRATSRRSTPSGLFRDRSGVCRAFIEALADAAVKLGIARNMA